MQPRRASSRAPWDRRRGLPRHPLGRARRRWPRAYDGAGTETRALPARYRQAYERAYDGMPEPGERRRRRYTVPSMQELRSSPVRNGLIGLAIAGAAAPIAIQRYQQALRTDPSHERIATHLPGSHGIDDRAVMEQWHTMAAADLEAAAREVAIEEAMDRFADYGISRELAETIYDEAIEASVDPELAFGLVRAESSFRNSATSPVGAIGLTQLMPRTAAWMEPGVSTRELRNPRTNLRVGLKYLTYLLNKYQGNEDLALLAYNRGPGTVDRILRRGGNPDNGYAAFVRGQEDHGHTLFSSSR
jgi:soluble lytic murein transglycosylase-like protein